MKQIIKNKLKALKEGSYGDGLLEALTIVDTRTYRGKGRPRKTDYMSAIEAQRRINELRNSLI